MNQGLLQPLSLGSEYPLSSEQECIDHINTHAHHSSFAAGGVSDSLRRNGGAMNQSAGLLAMPSNGLRYMAHRPAAHDGQYPAGSTISDSGSASISTSPSSNSSSLAFSTFPTSVLPQQPVLGVANAYPPSQIYANLAPFSQGFVNMANMKPRISSMTDPSATGMLPPSRSPGGMGNPVSPSLSATARDNYTTATPHLNRHTLSPRAHPESLSRASYSSMPDTPRSVLSNNMSLSPPSASVYNSTSTVLGYPSQHDVRPTDTPPFASLEQFHQINCDGQTVVPHIEAKIEKGFFFSADRTWTCYRRNYFSVQCSYSLNPHVQNGRLFLTRNSNSPEQIQAMSVTLSAAVDGASGKIIELVQHTPKRDKGPQMHIKMEKLLPTPPGKVQGESHNYGLNAFHNPVAVHSPYLPLQQDQQQPFSPAGHSTSTYQHTFERIQFKSATANNGKRRAQQQYYHLIVELHADVRAHGAEKPDWVKVAQRVSAAVVVRGRSPSHYQNEGPHNASSRGAGGAGGAGGFGHQSLGSAGGIGAGTRTLGAGFALGGALGNSAYRGSQYSIDPSPLNSHPVSTASSINSTVDGLVPDGIIPSEEDTKPTIENFEGYQYMPGPLFEAGLIRAKTEGGSDEETRTKAEYTQQATLPTAWHMGGCGRFQVTETSRGYYPDLQSTGY